MGVTIQRLQTLVCRFMYMDAYLLQVIKVIDTFAQPEMVGPESTGVCLTFIYLNQVPGDKRGHSTYTA